MPSQRPKLQMLKPRVPMLEDRIPTLKAPRAKRSGRDADPRRTLPLNSAAWQRLRASVLAGEPLCRMCQARGLVVPATDVDHASGDPSDNSRENLTPLCHECHSRKTASDHGKRVNHGCDANGMPLDPNHTWHQGTVAALLKKSPATDDARPPGSSRFNPKSK